MKQNKLGYFIKEGIHSIFTHGFMSFASVCIIVACLIIMGSFTLVALNVNSIISTLEDENEIVAYVDDSYSESEAKALQSKIDSIDNVSSSQFVSKEVALDSFVDQYENSHMLEDIEADVLRDRYVIYMDDISQISQTQEDLRQVEGIARVSAHTDIAKGFVTLRNLVTIVSVALIAILFIVSMFIISNTIKLTTFERREEIAIMKMVGATSGFIRGPFIIEGLLLGLIGTFVAYIAQWALYDLLATKLVENAGIGFISLIPFATISIPLIIAFMIVGFGVGMVGSSVAIRNYLKV